MSLIDEQEIGKTIESYLKAINTGDPKHLERSFYNDSVIINGGESDPKKSTMSMVEFGEYIKARKDKGISVEDIPLGIMISYVGNVANFRLDFEFKIDGKTLYGTDYLNLVKRNGKWKISQKIYQITHSLSDGRSPT